MATYSVTNFLATPSPSDTRLRIYDKRGKLRHTVDPDVAAIYKKANLVIIKIEDRNNIHLDFASASEAAQALTKLNDAKRSMKSHSTCDDSSNSKTIYSRANLNMPALNTVNDGDLACNSQIIDKPIMSSHVRAFINGVEINVGGKVYPYDAFFSADGITARSKGDERMGDRLYWNGSIAGYQLATYDLVDFQYLILSSD